MEDPQLFVEQAGSLAAQASALASNGQVLAWTAADHDIDRAERGNLRVSDLGHIAQVRDAEIGRAHV
jgi:hypothetical protein